MKIIVVLLSLVAIAAHAAEGTQILCASKVAEFPQDTRINSGLQGNQRWISPLEFVIRGNYLAAGVLEYGADPKKADLEAKREFKYGLYEIGETVTPAYVGPSGYMTTRILTIPASPLALALGNTNGVVRFDVGEEDGKLKFAYDATPKPHASGEIDWQAASGFLDPSDPRLIASLEANNHRVSPDGKFLLVDHVNSSVVYDARTGAERYKFKADLKMAGMMHNAFGSSITADSRYIVTAHQWGLGGIWNINDGKLVGGFTIPQSSMYHSPSINTAPDTNVVLVYVAQEKPGADRGFVEEEESEPKEEGEYDFESPPPQPAHQKEVTFSDLMYRLTEKNGEPTAELVADLATLVNYDGSGAELVWSRMMPGKELVLGDSRGEVVIYDVPDQGPLGKPKYVFRVTVDSGPPGRVTAVTKASDGRYAVGHSDGTVVIWNPEGSKRKQALVLKGNPFSVVNVTFAPNANKLLVQVRHRNDLEGQAMIAAVTNAYLFDLDPLYKN